VSKNFAEEAMHKISWSCKKCSTMDGYLSKIMIYIIIKIFQEELFKGLMKFTHAPRLWFR